MKVISNQEYDALNTFLEPRLFELWRHENSVRDQDNQLDGFTTGYGKFNVFHYLVEDGLEFYVVFNTGFMRIISEGLSVALQEHPESFGTGNASDVIDALYKVSGYHPFGELDSYIRYVADNNCCYVVYKNNGAWVDEILRIDLLRFIKPNRKNPEISDFVGGLLHTLKHFSVDGHYLSTGKENYDVFDITHLVYLIAMAFRLRVGEGKRYVARQELTNATMYGYFFFEEDSRFFFLDTYFKKDE